MSATRYLQLGVGGAFVLFGREGLSFLVAADSIAFPSATHEARSTWEAVRCSRSWRAWLVFRGLARGPSLGSPASPREVFLLSLFSLPPSSFPLPSLQAERARQVGLADALGPFLSLSSLPLLAARVRSAR